MKHNIVRILAVGLLCMAIIGATVMSVEANWVKVKGGSGWEYIEDYTDPGDDQIKSDVEVPVYHEPGVDSSALPEPPIGYIYDDHTQDGPAYNAYTYTPEQEAAIAQANAIYQKWNAIYPGISWNEAWLREGAENALFPLNFISQFGLAAENAANGRNPSIGTGIVGRGGGGGTRRWVEELHNGLKQN